MYVCFRTGQIAFCTDWLGTAQQQQQQHHPVSGLLYVLLYASNKCAEHINQQQTAAVYLCYFALEWILTPAA